MLRFRMGFVGQNLGLVPAAARGASVGGVSRSRPVVWSAAAPAKRAACMAHVRMMASAASGDTVNVHYTGTLDSGAEFDSSRTREPLVVTLGAGQVIPGFEKALIGMNVGEKTDVHIPVEEAYGPRRDELVVTMDRSKAPEGIQSGMMVQLSNGQPAQVTDVTEQEITIDVNHPLAGEALNFNLELVSIN